MATQNEDRKPVPPALAFKRDVDTLTIELFPEDEKKRARFRSAAMIAVNKEPKLLNADQASLFMGLRLCAEHNVMPDGIEATLQVYNTRVKEGREERWISKVQYMPMIRGIINRVLRSGRVQTFWAERVHEGEEFRIDETQGDRRPVHNFDPFRRTGPILGYYSVVKYTSGAVDCEVMTMADVNRVKATAKTKDVWDKWPEEKAKVAVMRRHSKRLPLSSEDMAFIMGEDEHDLIESEGPDQLGAETPLQRRVREERERQLGMIDITPEAGEEEEPAHWTSFEPLRFNAETPAFAEGREAFIEGQPSRDCPYEEDSLQANDWLAGWHDARREA